MLRLRHLLVLVVALCAMPMASAGAQCADGSPPPCRSQRIATPAPRAVDPNRIAVLPFRVTTSDSLLGEGFAELLATEITTDKGVRALDMATVINSWRRAGGGLRTPLTRDRALTLARALGAGLVVEGSIVGLGREISITTSIVNSSDGAPRGRPTRVTASTDSIHAAVRQTSSGVVAAMGGQQRLLEGARYTESPDAMRHYMEALALWRRGRLVESQQQLERAMALDTLFAQAAFRSHLADGWNAPPKTIPLADITRRAFALRDRLSTAERTILEAYLGPNYPAPRSTAERIVHLTRAANLLPETPEAQFLLGDYWLHFGAALDPGNQLARAREYIERSVAIDSQATALRHLLEIYGLQRDTAALRRLLPAYARTEDGGRWAAVFLGWSILGDERELAAARRSSVVDADANAIWPLIVAAMADVPAARLDELISLWRDGYRGNPLVNGLTSYGGTTLAMRGRPMSAERLWGMLPLERHFQTDRMRIMLALTDDADGLDVVGAVARMSDRLKDAVAPNSPAACELILWRKKNGLPLGDTSGTFRGSCARVLAITRIDLKAGPSATAAMETAESNLRADIANFEVNSYEPFYLARAWEAAGQPRRGLETIRLRTMGTYLQTAFYTLDEEARLALVAGDTASAVRALQFYLPIIADAEPPVTAKRDSLRALLTRLTAKR